eukprot:233358-Rhodomonas_salina.3
MAMPVCGADVAYGGTSVVESACVAIIPLLKVDCALLCAVQYGAAIDESDDIKKRTCTILYENHLCVADSPSGTDSGAMLLPGRRCGSRTQ